MSRSPLSLAVLISGNGSNLQAILDAIGRGLPARVCGVISNRAEAYGLERARRHGVPAHVIDSRNTGDRTAFDRTLQATLTDLGPDLVVLAGFMRILGDELVTDWHGRMLNIHPSLLPAYRGLHTHRRVLKAGELWHGTSVHYVTPELDGGPVIAQARIRIHPQDTEDSLMARVQAEEHRLYPRVIEWIARGRLTLRDKMPVLDGKPLKRPVIVDTSTTTEQV